MSFVLFYSLNCRYCAKFINVLKKYPEINSEFQKYAIESLQQLPQGLAAVPTVMDKSKGKMFAAQQAFDWLENKVKNSFEASMDISGKSGNNAEFSFIEKDEKNFSGKFAVLGQEQNNGTNINPSHFDSQTGKPLHSAPAQQFVPPTPQQMTQQQFEQMNSQMNNQMGSNMESTNVPLETAMNQRQETGTPQIQRNDAAFNSSVNQSVQDSGVSNQAFKNYQNKFNQFQTQQFNGQGQNGNEQENNGPALPPQLQPISVSQQSTGVNLDDVMARRNMEVPQPRGAQGGGNSFGSAF